MTPIEGELATKTEKLVAFCVLMQNGEGIRIKSPDYIMSKFEVTQMCGKREHLRGLLDEKNQAIFDKWLILWRAYDTD